MDLGSHKSALMSSAPPSIICVEQQKGGAGKTTTCISLSGISAANGFMTGLLDLDHQKSAFEWLGQIDHYDDPMDRPQRQIMLEAAPVFQSNYKTKKAAYDNAVADKLTGAALKAAKTEYLKAQELYRVSLGTIHAVTTTNEKLGVYPSSFGELEAHIDAMTHNGAQHIYFDAPGHAAGGKAIMYQYADLIVIPVKASMLDARALRKSVLPEIASLGKPYLFVMNELRGSRNRDNIEESLLGLASSFPIAGYDSKDHLCEIGIPARECFGACTKLGLTLTEFAHLGIPRNDGSDELDAVFNADTRSAALGALAHFEKVWGQIHNHRCFGVNDLVEEKVAANG